MSQIQRSGMAVDAKSPLPSGPMMTVKTYGGSAITEERSARNSTDR